MSFIPVAGTDYIDVARRRLSGKDGELTWLRQFREILRPQLGPGVTIVDIGCSTAYAYRSFADFGVRYIGVDFEPAFLEVAAEHHAGNPDVTLLRHDITAAPADVSGDIVISSAMLEHCPSLSPALENMAAAARQTLLLRTFFAEQEVIESYVAPVPGNDDGALKFANAYAFVDVRARLAACGFGTDFLDDAYTGSRPRVVQERTRTFHIARAERR